MTYKVLQEKYSTCLSNLGYKLPTTPIELGSGSYGTAYDIGNNVVLKITADKSEAISSKLIEGETLKFVNHIYNVFLIPEHNEYAIFQRKVRPLSYKSSVRHGLCKRRFCSDDWRGVTKKGRYESLLKKDWPNVSYHIKKRIITFYRNVALELEKFKIVFHDGHQGNVCRIGHDQLVMIDLGASSSPRIDIETLEEVHA